MNITAKLISTENGRRVSLQRNGETQDLSIPFGPSGSAAGANGGEYLLLALATCYSNDLYHEADKRGISVEQLEVEVEIHFGVEGEPARNVVYRVRLIADAPEQQLRELVNFIDRVAEVHNTLRLGIPVILNRVEAISV